MNIVDSSAWLAYLANEPNAKYFSKPIEDIELLLVPSICIYEVFKVILRERDENDAFHAVTAMQLGKIIDLDFELSIEAAALGFKEKLALADSIIYTIAKRYNAILWTQDEHFKHLSNVQFKKKISL